MSAKGGGSAMGDSPPNLCLHGVQNMIALIVFAKGRQTLRQISDDLS
jgi:hypothetical protein